MAPQDDLTAERAAQLVEAMLVFIEKTSRRKLSFSAIVDMNTGTTENPQDRLVAAVIKHDKQTRQAALREARDYALACVAERNKQAFELTKTVLNDPRAVWLGCKASEAERIAEWIDRLASEGA